MLTTLKLTPAIDASTAQFLSQHYVISASASWQLDCVDGVFHLQHTEHPALNLAIDFGTGKYRHRNHYLGKEPLVNAIKIKGKLPQALLDATPGLLQDSFMLARRGVQITAIERHPLLYVMVNRALARISAQTNERHHTQTPPHIDYRFGDANTLVKDFATPCIYLDPMYPPRQKKALVKKSMQVLHATVGDDADSDTLLINAQKNNARIIVKRPSYAPPLANCPPDLTYQSKTTRFDIYLPQNS